MQTKQTKQAKQLNGEIRFQKAPLESFNQPKNLDGTAQYVAISLQERSICC